MGTVSGRVVSHLSCASPVASWTNTKDPQVTACATCLGISRSARRTNVVAVPRWRKGVRPGTRVAGAKRRIAKSIHLSTGAR